MTRSFKEDAQKHAAYRSKCVAMYDARYEEFQAPAADFAKRVKEAWDSTESLPDALVEEFSGYSPVVKICAWSHATQNGIAEMEMAKEIHSRLSTMVLDIFSVTMSGVDSKDGTDDEQSMLIYGMQNSKLGRGY